MKFNLRRDQQYRKRKKRESTKKFKRKRLNRKKKRSKYTEMTEVLEGPTYQSGVQFSGSTENPIPIPTPQPKPVCSPIISSNIKKSVYIVYDIETSNIGKLTSVTNIVFKAEIIDFLTNFISFLLLYINFYYTIHRK